MGKAVQIYDKENVKIFPATTDENLYDIKGNVRSGNSRVNYITLNFVKTVHGYLESTFDLNSIGLENLPDNDLLIMTVVNKGNAIRNVQIYNSIYYYESNILNDTLLLRAENIFNVDSINVNVMLSYIM